MVLKHAQSSVSPLPYLFQPFFHDGHSNGRTPFRPTFHFPRQCATLALSRSISTDFASILQGMNPLGRTIGQAWKTISDPARQLILFCWCGLNSVRHQRNCIAHPNLNKSSAKLILRQDFRGTFDNLHAAAHDMADYLFSD